MLTFPLISHFINDILRNKTMSKYIGPEITLKFKKPLIFSGINTGPIKYYGFSIDNEKNLF